ncbi:UNKNOWN [Stylonychia lemnae]|uniref:Uncharacterized protein n=1 Tax=Stylonychia lemnae TaxID=5949 RepID=A0A078A7Z8_STYLE|nr:UNKNOWN [Stylonychia lemnae]|eukprot:CDW77991.1 UNKNOWN [Stylonychia lemnae]
MITIELTASIEIQLAMIAQISKLHHSREIKADEGSPILKQSQRSSKHSFVGKKKLSLNSSYILQYTVTITRFTKAITMPQVQSYAQRAVSGSMLRNSKNVSQRNITPNIGTKNIRMAILPLFKQIPAFLRFPLPQAQDTKVAKAPFSPQITKRQVIFAYIFPNPVAATKIGSPRCPAKTKLSISTNREKIQPIIIGNATFAKFKLIQQRLSS